MQVEENVNTSNFLLVGNQAGNGNNISKENQKNQQIDFSDFLVSAGGKNVNDSSATGKTNDFSDVVDEKDTEPSNENAQSNEITSSNHEDDLQSTDSVEQTDGLEQTDGPEQTDCQELINDVETDLSFVKEKTEDDQEVVLAAFNSIIQMVMEQFCLLPEELTAKLNEFGMELKELGTKEGIREFFLNMESADLSDLLVNETLNQELYTFTENFLQLLDQDGLTEENLETVLQGINVDALLTENEKPQEPVMDENPEQSESLFGVQEEMAGEPEVLISEKNTKPAKDMEKQPENRKGDNSSEMTEWEPEKETSVTHGERFENPILQVLDDAVSRVQETNTTEEKVPENNIIKQIVEQVRVSMNQNSTSMELQLYPEHLGKIQIHVVSKAGVMTARIAAETEAARQAVEGGLSSLKDTLEQQNLKVEAIEVMVSTTGFEHQSGEQNSYQEKNDSKSGRKLNLSGMDDDIPQDEEAENLKMMAAGSSVSYTA